MWRERGAQEVSGFARVKCEVCAFLWRDCDVRVSQQFTEAKAQEKADKVELQSRVERLQEEKRTLLTHRKELLTQLKR